MSPRPPDGARAARHPAWIAAVALLAFPCSPAAAGTWASAGLLGGSTFVDAKLASYQWDTNPRAAWGAQALLGRGRFALGARAWRSQTVQVLDLPTGPVAPDVRSTTLEALGRVRVASPLGAGVWACASLGGLRIDYRPDHVVVSSGGSGSPVTAALDPVDEWIAGAGVAIDRRLGDRWSAGVALDRQFYSLDTAHRSGATIIDQRQAFGDWNARLEIAWLFSHTAKEGSR